MANIKGNKIIKANIVDNSNSIKGNVIENSTVIKANVASGGGSSKAQWGKITGDILEQEDLQEQLSTKADGMYYDTEQNLLYLTCNDEIITEGIPISGGGSQTIITLTNLLPSDTLTIAKGNSAVLSYSYSNSEDLEATAQYIVNNNTKSTQKLNSGDRVDFDISSYLNDGYNYVEVTVTDTAGTKRTLIYTVTVVVLSISSSFDNSIAYSEPITFRYTPYGEVTKTIHFEIDGTETTETTDVSGRQLSKIIELTHGVHQLRVWETATLGGTTILSNILSYEVMYVDGDSVLIASDFNGYEFYQGEMINIPLIVYNPLSLTTDLDIYVNNELVSSMNVNRNKFTYSRVIDTIGISTISFRAEGTTRNFTVNIIESEIDVEPVTQNLELFLSANGRSNNDKNRNEWKYGSINCSLNNFNFVNNGWINNSLVISNGASVTIPTQLFAQDFRNNGKTIEIEFSTSNVLDYNAKVVDCFSGDRGIEIFAQNALLKSEQSEVNIKFKEDEHIRLGFVVEPRSENRLIYTYLNGIISGLMQYPDDDDFSQINPVNIVIGSNNCDVAIYNIRVYNNNLNHYDMLNNYIADTSDYSKKLSLFNNNDIYDSYGNIVYNKLLNQVPIMTITGDLPQSKGDKKIVKIDYEDKADSTRNFSMEGVTIDVQGTSSQYYPKKNYKISKMPQAYRLRPNSPAEKTFTLKADYMESSHAHNTGLAKLINDIYIDKTPPQENDENIRTTIDGFPIAIYYKANASSNASYFGVYNFNNDKSSSNVFGFTDGCESWEFGNNTSPRCLFLSDDFSDPDEVLTDFEARHPKDYTDFANLQDIITWVYDCYQLKDTTGVNKFKEECENYFNLDYLLTYYVISEFFGMVDSRAKNMFLNLYTDNKWYPVFYDMDTAIGLNNEGENKFNYDIETHDVIGTEYVFNGANSGLWYLVEQAFSDEIEETYVNLRNSGRLTYEKALYYLNDEQIAKICEAQYNSDADFKYISPLLDDGIATYLYTAQGSRIDHIKWWLFNRFNYLDSKYIASDFKANYMTMRIYTPAQWQEVEPDAEITVTPYADQYIRIKYGSYDRYQRAKSGVATTITPPAITFNDTETIIYGASRIKSVGDLSPLYAGTIDVSSAVKLSELKIGEGGTYVNTNLTGLTLGNNTLLQSLDIRNCPNLSGALDISGCTGIKEIYATGTSLTSVKLAEAGSITDLVLPSTITNLTVKNQNNIVNFSCGNSVSTLILENTNLDSKSIFLNNPVTKVRITGVDWTVTDFSILDTIYNLIGSDENGNNTPHGVLAGIVRINKAKASTIEKYQAQFPDIQFIVNTYLDEDVICTNLGEIILTDDNKKLVYT